MNQTPNHENGPRANVKMLGQDAPAFIAVMPPSPETARRWWTMYCRACGIEEGMAESENDPRLIAHRDEHNRKFHGSEGRE